MADEDRDDADDAVAEDAADEEAAEERRPDDEATDDEATDDEATDDEGHARSEPPPHRDAPAGAGRSVVAGIFALLAIAAVAGLAMHRARPPARCADGLEAMGTRCCGEGQTLNGDRCSGPPNRCSGGMNATPIGCVAESRPITLPGGLLKIAPHDWEAAERRVKPREANVPAFAIDSHEVTEQRWDLCAGAKACPTIPISGEPGRAMVGVSAVEAETFCAWAGGRLPTSDEWAYAASGTQGRRYPWGDTGAVCRRAAFGLADGPCATGAKGPELAGAHPEGATAAGIHDLAGNVAEWTAPFTTGKNAGKAAARGGSWRDRTAADLRVYGERLLEATARSDSIGFRCAYATGKVREAGDSKP